MTGTSWVSPLVIDMIWPSRLRWMCPVEGLTPSEKRKMDEVLR